MDADAATPDERRTKIAVKGLTKRFGDLMVLNDISFDVAQGEFLAIVGPTGCGKTTFLNCLSKLMPTSNGDIFIDGEVADPKRHNISFVFQEPTCLPWRTVRRNVSYGMELKGFPKEKIRERVDYMLNLVGLTDTQDLYPNQVSASMVQRITVARAFAVDPDLLLMDEPYGQLDVKLRYYLEDELVKLWQTLKSTVIFVTHNIEEAVYVAERVDVRHHVHLPHRLDALVRVLDTGDGAVAGVRHEQPDRSVRRLGRLDEPHDGRLVAHVELHPGATDVGGDAGGGLAVQVGHHHVGGALRHRRPGDGLADPRSSTRDDDDAIP